MSFFDRRRDGVKRTGRIYLIATEGETEQDYMATLRSHRGLHSQRVAFVRHEHTDPLGIVRSLIAERDRLIDAGGYSAKAGDVCWALFDVDEHRQEDRAAFNRAIALANKERVFLGLSNPCIEIWLLLHFQSCGANMHRKTACSEIRKILKDHEKRISPRNGKALMAALDVALVNAARLHKRNSAAAFRKDPFVNPSTHMDRLAALLLKETI